jgi:hypothetical protein
MRLALAASRHERNHSPAVRHYGGGRQDAVWEVAGGKAVLVVVVALLLLVVGCIEAAAVASSS